MNRPLGIDISKYDQVFDPRAAWESGVRFVIVRSGYGLVADSLFEQHTAKITNLPQLVRGAYHYLSSAIPGKQQADFLLQRAGGWADFLVIDFESAFNSMSARFVNECLSALEHLRANTNKPVLLYTNPNIYNVYIVTSSVGRRFSAFPLWIAQYPSTRWEDVKDIPESERRPALPRGRSDWLIWQFTAYAPARQFGVTGKVAVDLNVWNGDSEFYKQFARFNSVQSEESIVDITYVRSRLAEIHSKCAELTDALSVLVEYLKRGE